MTFSTESLLEALYGELRELAQRKLGNERPDHTLQTTALINEAFIKLSDRPVGADWHSQSHFLRVAAEAMRRILVDHARARLAQKRGSGVPCQSDVDFPIELPLPPEEIIAIHECLDRFSEEDPIKAELVKLRVFAGLSHKEAAEQLEISRQTADRYWAYAKVRLYSMMA